MSEENSHVKAIHKELEKMIRMYRDEPSALIRRTIDNAVESYILQETDEDERGIAYRDGFQDFYDSKKREGGQSNAI